MIVQQVAHWILTWTGSNNVSGTQYGFWSGFGSDIGEFGIITGLFMHLKRQNCHVKGCPSLMTYPVPGTPFKACKNHNPAVPKEITHFHILKAHKKANQ